MDIPQRDFAAERMTVTVIINKQPHTVTIEPRMTLLDALREELGLTPTPVARR